MTILAILGYSGGVTAFVSAVIYIGRGIFKQIAVTEDNTEAVNKLTLEVTSLKDGFYTHETRITVLEAVNRRNRRRLW